MSEELELGGEGEGHEEGNHQVEAEARKQGWVPQEEWRGRPDAWTDADTFVRRGEEINPILRKALKEERARTASLEQNLKAQGATVAELRSYLEKVEQNAVKNALATLKQQRKEAVANGDLLQADELAEQIVELRDSPSSLPPKEAAVAQAPAELPEVAAWLERNPWCNESYPELVEYSQGAALSLRQKDIAAGRQSNPAAILEEVAKKTRKAFANHPAFAEGSDESGGAGMFDGGGSGAGGGGNAPRTKGKGFASLPSDAKAQFKRFYDAGFYKKGDKNIDLAAAQAEYFKDYQ
jgi:hypothetical protein